jgi:oligopeptidase A
MHPFTDRRFAVRWSTLVPESVEPDIRIALEEARENLAAISALDPASLTYENTFLALENASESLNRAWGRLQHLDSVVDDPAQRAALNQMLPEVSEFYSSIPLNESLWAVLKAYGTSTAVAALTEIQQRHVEETILDFVHSGADLPPDKKQRVAEIDAELSLITKSYSEHVLDSTNAWEMLISDVKQLAGLPESAIAAALANATAKGVATEEKPAWRFTLHQPSMFPIMQYADDDSLRHRVWKASAAVGAEGDCDNTQLVWKILELRDEKAKLLGHKNFADLTLQRRMAKNGETALSFTEDLHDRIVGAFKNDYKELCAYKAEKTSQPCDGLEPWEVSYWSEKRRKECYDLDDEILRPYFPVNQVMSGMFDLAATIFGIDIIKLDTVYYDKGSRSPNANENEIETWHPEVTFYELRDRKSGEHLGSFYADWHPRESKRGGAWMNQIESGLPPMNGNAREPHLGLIIGNMTPPVNDQPALLTHGEVETIFHEFGHLLHGLLSDVAVKSLAGTNVPWDFVELPSQIMENFCWSRESLDLFAKHYQTGETIPEALYQKMIDAKNYMSASVFMRQLALGKLDLELHVNLDHYRGQDLDALERSILADYRVALKTDAPGMARRFNHLFSSPTGYAAGYYSYKWAEVLDADAFTRFDKEGILNQQTGHDFREHVLSKGNSAPVDDLYRRFMGRDPILEPLLIRAGLINDPVLA